MALIAGYDVKHARNAAARKIAFHAFLRTAYALLLSFLWISLDYKKSEKFRIEDDEYYYYVKAIPKAKTDGAPYEAPEPGEAAADEAPLVERPEVDDIDFESRLEESLKNL